MFSHTLFTQSSTDIQPDVCGVESNVHHLSFDRVDLVF